MSVSLECASSSALVYPFALLTLEKIRYGTSLLKLTEGALKIAYRIDEHRRGNLSAVDEVKALYRELDRRIQEHRPIKPQVADQQVQIEAYEERPMSVAYALMPACHRVRQLVQQDPGGNLAWAGGG